MSQSNQDRGGFVTEDTIFITGLPEDIAEEQLGAYFGQIGVIKFDKKNRCPKIWIYKDKATGKGKGEATITYDDPPTATSAISWFNGKEFQGSKITVQLAERKSAPQFSRGGGRGGGAGPGRGGRGGGGGRGPSFDRGNRDFERGGRDFDRGSRDFDRGGRDFDRSGRNYDRDRGGDGNRPGNGGRGGGGGDTGRGGRGGGFDRRDFRGSRHEPYRDRFDRNSRPDHRMRNSGFSDANRRKLKSPS